MLLCVDYKNAFHSWVLSKKEGRERDRSGGRVGRGEKRGEWERGYSGREIEIMRGGENV